MGLLLGVAFGVASLLFSPATGLASSPAKMPSSLQMGLNVPGIGSYSSMQAVDRTVAQAHALHAAIVRVEIPWSLLEPRGPGQLEPRALAVTDRLVADATHDNMHVIMTADSTPCWASSAPAKLLAKCVPEKRTQANAWPPSETAPYAAFVAFLAERYGTRLAAIEIWNEPDQANELYFAGPGKVARYAALLRAAYPAIKHANPNVIVLGGSLVGTNGLFLRDLYAAGIKGYYDGLAVHFYTLTLAALRATHEVQLANGDTTPLWLDEFGWGSCWPKKHIEEEQGCVTAKTQAANVTNTLREMSRMPYVATAVLFKLQDSPGEEFGVLSTKGARKPAYAGFMQAADFPLGSISPVKLSLRRKGNQLVASGSASVGEFMELEAFQGSTLRYKALFTLDRFNDYSLVLPAALGTSGLSVRVFQYGAPSNSAQKSA